MFIKKINITDYQNLWPPSPILSLILYQHLRDNIYFVNFFNINCDSYREDWEELKINRQIFIILIKFQMDVARIVSYSRNNFLGEPMNLT